MLSSSLTGKQNNNVSGLTFVFLSNQKEAVYASVLPLMLTVQRFHGLMTETFLLQIKDMALKASGAYKNCKPCSGSSTHNQRHHYAESEAASASEKFHCSYRRTGSSSSTPRLWGKEMEARLKGLSSGEVTPASVSGRAESVVFMEEDGPSEWVAQVEPGILITVVSLPQGGNDLKRIRFRYFTCSLFNGEGIAVVFRMINCSDVIVVNEFPCSAVLSDFRTDRCFAELC